MARLTDPSLSALAGIDHGFFTREDGASIGLYAGRNCGVGSKDDPAAVALNRARVAEELGAETLLTVHQFHSADVVTVTDPFTPDSRPKADAMVTTTPGLALGALAADCTPILFADGEAGVIGAAHAGWGGAFKGVAEATLAAMIALGAEPWRTVAVIGPCIRQPSYEVGPEFLQRFLEQDPGNARFFVPSSRSGHQQFDLPGYLAHRMTRAGVGRIADIGRDTYSDEEKFYSYRRATHRGEADYGRLVSAIVLKGSA